MQRPSEEKRRKILEAAARLFATRPFDKVRLDDIAADAHVGKGTLYIYFSSKEQLYGSLIDEAFSRVIQQLTQQITPDTPPQVALEQIVRSLVAFAFEHPYFFELIRTTPLPRDANRVRENRAQLTRLTEAVVRRGVEAEGWCDPDPALTAAFLPGFVRSAMIAGPRNLSADKLTSHILHVLRQGVQQPSQPQLQKAKSR